MWIHGDADHPIEALPGTTVKRIFWRMMEGNF
jgi:hypothetical protein